jgi:nitroreductase
VDAALMDLRDAMQSTGTCRFYRPDPVPDDLLRRVLDATRWAPTGGNRQGVRFVAVRDAGRRRQLADLYLPLWEQYVARATYCSQGGR